MAHRAIADAVVFIALGTFLSGYALTLIIRRDPGRPVSRFGANDGARGEPVSRTLGLIGVLSAIWGGTGLADHLAVGLAVIAALGPQVGLRAVLLWWHRRQLRRRYPSTHV